MASEVGKARHEISGNWCKRIMAGRGS